MGVLGKIGGGIKFMAVRTTKSVFSIDRHAANVNYIKEQASRLATQKKLSIDEMKAIVNQKQSADDFQHVLTKRNVSSLDEQRQFWKMNMLLSYVFMFAFAINIVALTLDFHLAHVVSSIGFGLVSFMLWMLSSFRAYQIQNQKLHLLREFLSSPLEWFANPVWAPKVSACTKTKRK